MSPVPPRPGAATRPRLALVTPIAPPRQDAVAIQMEEARLVKIKEVLKELPVPHYR